MIPCKLSGLQPTGTDFSSGYHRIFEARLVEQPFRKIRGLDHVQIHQHLLFVELLYALNYRSTGIYELSVLQPTGTGSGSSMAAIDTFTAFIGYSRMG